MINQTTKKTKNNSDISTDEIVGRNIVVGKKIFNLSAKDLYSDSKFFRDFVSPEKRGVDNNQDSSEDIINGDIVVEAAEELYKKLDNTEKEFVENYIDSIDLSIEMTHQITDLDTTADDEMIKSMIEQEAISDELVNNLGQEEVVIDISIENMTTRGMDNGGIQGFSGQLPEFNINSYEKIKKNSRSVYKGQIIKASELAYYFALAGKFDELDNINKEFGCKIDIAKIKSAVIKLTGNQGAQTRSFLKDKKAGFYDTSLPGSEEYLKNTAADGDIFIRLAGNDNNAPKSCIYGNYDHAAIFSKTKYKSGEFQNTKWAKCVLGAYPDRSAPSGNRAPERIWYGAYEPAANFLDARRCAIMKPKNRQLGSIALKFAEEKYLTGRTVDNAIIVGYYTISVQVDSEKGRRYEKRTYPYYQYDQDRWFDDSKLLSEFFKYTSDSLNDRSSITYCSRIAWYGYTKAGIDINGDPANVYSGNIVVPEDLMRASSNQSYQALVKVRESNSYGSYEVSKLVTLTKPAVLDTVYYRER